MFVSAHIDPTPAVSQMHARNPGPRENWAMVLPFRVTTRGKRKKPSSELLFRVTGAAVEKEI